MTEDDSGVRFARGSSGDLPEDGLARDLSDLARQMQAEASIESLFDSIVAAALREVEAAEYAGISLIEARRVHTEAASEELIEKIDELQYRAGDGPCLTALREHLTVRSADLQTETRWPGFARDAAGEGIRSMLSFQLFVEGDNLGALNLYATVPDAFTETTSGWAAVGRPCGDRHEGEPQQHQPAGRAGQPGCRRPGQGHPHGTAEDRSD